jgi:hypothetical protein
MLLWEVFSSEIAHCLVKGEKEDRRDKICLASKFLECIREVLGSYLGWDNGNPN